MLSEPVLESDISATFYPDAIDLETIKTRNCEYTMGRLSNGEVVVKQITYFGGCNTSLIAIGISRNRLRNQHKEPWCLPFDDDPDTPID